MRILYIGQFTEGTTSKMRGNQINSILKPNEFNAIDTHLPFYKINRISRSFGFRFKRGPLISKVNKFVLTKLHEIERDKTFDLIWVDKAVFLTKKTTKKLKKKTNRLIHFTPDPAFTYHRSRHFIDSLKEYDYLVTTKSYELDEYYKHTEKSKTLFATQGFDRNIHCPTSSGEKKSGIIFIGHHEEEREKIMTKLLNEKITVKLAGIKWKSFADQNKNNPYLKYLGEGIYGEDYVNAISGSTIAWGAISKWIPEKHTTRTFEIPACGTALLTERNEEINSFFNEDEAIFYSSPEEMIQKINYYLKNINELQDLTRKGYERVHKDGYDYESILRKILDRVLV